MNASDKGNAIKALQGALYETRFANAFVDYDDFLLSPHDFARERRFHRIGETYTRRYSGVSQARVLEIGLGLTPSLERSRRHFGFKAYATDFVKSSLHAQYFATGKTLQLSQADAEKLPFKNETFDAVVSISVLEHVPHFEIALLEIYRVLKPGGRVLLQMPVKDFRFSLLGRGRSYHTLHHEPWFKDLEKETGHDFAHIPTRRGWVEYAKTAGFKICKTEGSDILLDSWAMYYAFAVVKKIFSMGLRLKRRWREKDKAQMTHLDPQNQPGHPQPASPLGPPRYSRARRALGKCWFYGILYPFWGLTWPERFLGKLPLGASLYLWLEKP